MLYQLITEGLKDSFDGKDENFVTFLVKLKSAFHDRNFNAILHWKDAQAHEHNMLKHYHKVSMTDCLSLQ